MTAIPTTEQALEAEVRALRAEIDALEARHRDALDELLAMRSAGPEPEGGGS